jgi:hypothetical protein
MLTAQDYGVKVKIAYLNMQVGRVIFPPAMLRDQLVRCGFVERLTGPADAIVEEKAQAPQPPKFVRK